VVDRVKDQTADVIVLGAGIVGVSAAYAARQRGLSVILLDRREPGSETSYGNAGILSSGSILPLNKPSLWSALPTYITNPTRRCAGIRPGRLRISTGSSASLPMRRRLASNRGQRPCTG
jgi:glycine/D-amino acid oxidase-like deaminating enzyme